MFRQSALRDFPLPDKMCSKLLRTLRSKLVHQLFVYEFTIVTNFCCSEGKDERFDVTENVTRVYIVNVLNWRYAQKIKENFTDETSIYNCWLKLAGYGAEGIHSHFDIQFGNCVQMRLQCHYYPRIWPAQFYDWVGPGACSFKLLHCIVANELGDD